MKFTREHFDCFWNSAINGPIGAERAAEIANYVLETHLATLPRMYGRVDGIWGADNEPTDTHTALLWGITEIEKKSNKKMYDMEGLVLSSAAIAMLEKMAKQETINNNCIHEPYPDANGIIRALNSSCKHCGVKLKTKWEPA